MLLSELDDAANLTLIPRNCSERGTRRGVAKTAVTPRVTSASIAVLGTWAPTEPLLGGGAELNVRGACQAPKQVTWKSISRQKASRSSSRTRK